MPKFVLIAGDLPENDDDHSDEPEYTDALDDNLHEVEHIRSQHDESVKEVKGVVQIHQVRSKTLKNNFNQEKVQENIVNLGHDAVVYFKAKSLVD